jgi:hypothetical protein
MTRRGEEDGRRRVMHDDGSRGLGVRIPHGGAVDGAQVPLGQANQRSDRGVHDPKRLIG